MHISVELMALSLTLSGGLEVERLETPSERRGVDDIHTVFAAVLPVKHDGNYEDRHGDDASSETRVQSYIVGALHAWNTQGTRNERQCKDSFKTQCLSQSQLIAGAKKNKINEGHIERNVVYCTIPQH